MYKQKWISLNWIQFPFEINKNMLMQQLKRKLSFDKTIIFLHVCRHIKQISKTNTYIYNKLMSVNSFGAGNLIEHKHLTKSLLVSIIRTIQLVSNLFMRQSLLLFWEGSRGWRGFTRGRFAPWRRVLLAGGRLGRGGGVIVLGRDLQVGRFTGRRGTLDRTEHMAITFSAFTKHNTALPVMNDKNCSHAEIFFKILEKMHSAKCKSKSHLLFSAVAHLTFHQFWFFKVLFFKLEVLLNMLSINSMMQMQYVRYFTNLQPF